MNFLLHKLSGAIRAHAVNLAQNNVDQKIVVKENEDFRWKRIAVWLDVAAIIDNFADN